jgi:hypothetical protein
MYQLVWKGLTPPLPPPRCICRLSVITKINSITEMKSVSVQTQLNSICYVELRVSTYLRSNTLRKKYFFLNMHCGPGSVVGIATGYGLDGPGIESRWGRDFPHLSGPTLGPTQPPVQWVPGLSRGKERPGRDADPSVPSSAMVMKG